MIQTIIALVGMLLPTQPANVNDHFCATDHLHQQWIDQNHKNAQLHQKYEQALYQHLSTGAKSLSPPDFILPVVVHIIHDNGPENITDATVLQGMEHLNDAFENINYYDQGTGVDTKIQFCLAKRDPDGNATTGINRVETPLTEMIMETEDLDVKDLIRWDPTQYINIWLVREICSNAFGCGVAGYAYFPAAHGSDVDGILMEAEYFGSSEGGSGVTIHEMGHYLGVYHTFQGGCTNNDCLTDGDRVCDTPPDQSTAAVPCNGTPNSCNTDTDSGFATDQNDMFINYMDYGDFDCYSAFTQGQTDRMTFSIENTRVSLLDSEGCLDPCTNPITAGFNASTLEIDLGGTVNFTNTSTNANFYNWLVDDVTFAMSENASYQFNTLGSFEITLEVLNNDPNCKDDFTQTVEVVCPVEATFSSSNFNPAPGENVTFTNESTNAINAEWTINGVVEANTTDFTYAFLNPGVYQVCLNVDNNLCDNSECQYIFVPLTPGGCEESTFIKVYGEQFLDEIGYTITAGPDGNFYLGLQQDGETVIAVMDVNGNIISQTRYDFGYLNDIVGSIRFDSEGRIIGCGYSGTNAFDQEGFAFKVNPQTGAVIWTQRFSIPSRCYEIFELFPGSQYIITTDGDAPGFPGLGDEAGLTEVDRNTGALTGTFDKFFNLGSSETFNSTVVFDNNLFIAGRYTFAGGTQWMRASLSRFDETGNEIWSKLLHVPSNETARLYGRDLVIVNQSIYMVYSGDEDGISTALTQVYLAKFDLSGNLEWVQEYDIADYNNEWAEEMVVVSDGFVIMGNNRSGEEDLFLLKVDPNGNAQWAKGYGGPGTEDLSFASESQLFAASDYLFFLGETQSYGGDKDVFLVKTNPDGTIDGACAEVKELSVSSSLVANPIVTDVALIEYPSQIAPSPVNVNPAPSSMPLFIPPGCECTPEAECGDGGLLTIGDPEANELGRVIYEMPDGTFLIGGLQNDAAFLLNMDDQNTILWQKTLDFTNLGDQIFDIQLDSDGMLIGIGNTNVVANSRETFAFKYDIQNHNLIWLRRLALPNENLSSFTQIRELAPGGNYIIFGSSSPNAPPATGCDALFIEVDRNNGASQLIQNFSLNASCESFAQARWHAPTNSYFTTGRYTNAGGGFARMRPAISRIGPDGSHIWTKLYMVNADNQSARVYSSDFVLENNQMTVFGFGDYNGISANDVDLFTFQTDINGNLQWAYTYDIPGASTERSSAIVPAPNGFFLTGHFSDNGQEDGFLIKTDDTGQIEWAKRIGGTGDEFSRDMILANGLVYVLGHSSSLQPTEKIFLAKIDLEGNISGEDCDFLTPLEVNGQVYQNPFEGTYNLTTNLPNFNFNALQSSSVDAQMLVTEECAGACDELCFNGYDDDGDGLVDFFDPDCPCVDSVVCGRPFYNVCEPDCKIEPEIGPFSMEELWTFNNVGNNTIASVADVDGDCLPDIILPFTNNNLLRVLDGETGALKSSIPATFINNYTQGATGDVDLDGKAEIFVNIQNNGSSRLARYDWDDGLESLSLTWVSNQPVQSSSNVPAANFSPGLADFDFNGVAEVYIGNQIFNSQTGILLASGGNNSQGTFLLGTSNFMTSTSIAVDILSQENCATCTGLELVAGNQVYSVVLVSYDNPALNNMIVERELSTQPDGATRIVDFDRDGDLDAVVSTMTALNSGAFVYIWDLQTENLIGTPFTNIPNGGAQRIGHASIGDVDNDGWPEIVIATQSNFSILEDYQNGGGVNWGSVPASLKSTIGTTDTSGGTGASVFDLNGDGAVEIVYRDENNLRVLDQDLNTLSSIPCPSGTATEYPVIADMNGDNETELLCTCNSFNGYELKAFRSQDFPWVRTRQVWNQFNFFTVNIYDDGRIPVQQTAHHLVGDSVVLNNFLQQQPIYDQNGNPSIPAPDAVLTAAEASCAGDSTLVSLTICNEGDFNLIENTPITFYDGNPTTTNASVLETISLPVTIEADSCYLLEALIPLPTNTAIFVVVNDNGATPTPFQLDQDFPNTEILECDYTNNINNLEIPYAPPTLDLGPDIVTCENGVVTFDAGDDFFSYEWQDGFSESMYTTWFPGTYWVVVTDSCGGIQSDTVTVTFDPATELDLGADTTLCLGDSLVIQVPGYDNYEWQPADFLDCDTCATVVAVPDTSVCYILTASTDEGCYSVDTLKIDVLAAITTFDTLTFCVGDTLDIFGMPVTMPGDYSNSYPITGGCDSTHIITLLEAQDTIFEQQMATICQGDSIEIFGNFEFIPGVYTQIDSANCIFITDFTLTVLDTFALIDSISICEGETIDIFGNQVGTAGTYSQTFTSDNGCDSTVTIELTVLDTVLTTESITICENETADIFGTPTNIPGTYAEMYIGANTCDSTHQITLTVLDTIQTQELVVVCPGDSVLIFGNYESLPGTYTGTFTAANNCDSTHMITLSVLSPMQVDLTIIPTCEGAKEGSIQADVTGGLPPYSYLWSSGNTTTPDLDELAPGTYSLTVTDSNGCTTETSATVPSIDPPAADIETQDIGCFGEADGVILVTPGESGLLFSLDGENYTTDTLFENLSAGNYSIYVQNAIGCESVYQASLFSPSEIFLELPDELTINLGESITINSTTNSFAIENYLWLPGENLSCLDCLQPNASPTINTLYTLTITDASGCIATDEVFIRVIPIRDVYVPNAFSPNGDGINDEFYLQSGPNVANIRLLRIFDRWGEFIFEADNFPPNDPSQGWDGRFRGQMMNTGVYVFFAEIEYLDGVVEVVKGDVTLVR
jgi:gliding motility-associated-like protein